MSDSEQRPTDPCPFPWCTTPHGATLHPDDEDHRSDGILVPATVRGADGAEEVELEVGLLRRRADDQTWLVVEDGTGAHLELTLASARRLRDVVRADEALAAELRS
ncbi:hypothetical protein ABCS02_21905 [Microbacterium sp. X-17]|uniref:DUF6907 domain-containing protein n=1 Tax=Microbacterium sp. X-17 TaxID=3144404 RepID=UPI0031F5C683